MTPGGRAVNLGPLDLAVWGPRGPEVWVDCPVCDRTMTSVSWAYHVDRFHPRYVRPLWLAFLHWLVR
jgi:hypothetical protein